MKSLFHCKRATAIQNIITPMVFIFGLAIAFIISSMIAIEIFDQYETIATDPAATFSSPQLLAVIDSYQAVYSSFDYVIVGVLVGVMIAIAWTSYRLAARPVFYIVTLVMGIFYCFIGYILSYIFIQFVTNPVIAIGVSIFPLTVMICTNLHWVGLVLIVLGSIALYGKKPDEGDAVPLR